MSADFIEVGKDVEDAESWDDIHDVEGIHADVCDAAISSRGAVAWTYVDTGDVGGRYSCGVELRDDSKGSNKERRAVDGEDVTAGGVEDVGTCAVRMDGDELMETRGRMLREEAVGDCSGERARTRVVREALCKGAIVPVDGDPWS